MVKLILALLVIFGFYLLWRGPRRYTAGRPIKRATPKPRPAARKLPVPAAFGEEEARAILGLSTGAGPDEIKAAHRRLVSAVHPDRGGSEELTRRVNAARDLLLRL
ncbi:J domain-containing protein [Sphingomonas sp. IC-56]|uniref:J domain-containing protein n=1 Tax=Sphingomonas sp. IC-56 TaxID=2898529 RepID=UPI001E4A1069|nr:J domain-containing protein [Sphingomonas sp. IC-56]MCD2324802.1 J domain-containing protein [Sphingomonas sp. IC-56]